MSSNPAHHKLALTEQKLRSLKPRPKRYMVWDSVLPNFGARVTPNGRVSFIVARGLAGTAKLVFVTIGQFPVMGLADARTNAREAIGALSRGVHPRDLEQDRRREEARRRADTFVAVADEFLALRVVQLRSARDVTALIRNHLQPRWGDRPVTSIARRDVTRMLQELVAQGKPGAARHAFSAARSLFNWALTLTAMA